jgi:shikimate kinase
MQRSEQNIFLIGPMGSGKTTIGRLVARELGLEFHDCDQEIEKITGASVNLIFDVEGEEGFRERESRMLRELCKHKGILLSTGGGVVTRKRNLKLLKSNGWVIWLQTTVEQQIARLSHDKSRPLLQAPNRVSILRKLARERDPLYRECADLVFVSPDRNSKVAASALSMLIVDHWRAGTAGETRAHR